MDAVEQAGTVCAEARSGTGGAETRSEAARAEEQSGAARTEAQAEASRLNGARSRGPATPEGKERSRWNALRHGLAAEKVVVLGEEAAAFEEYRQAFYDDLRVQLEMNNYHYSGNDVLYNPVTGRKMTCTIYNGYVFYQLLKHTVLNKYQARSIGRRDQLTRAATSGRQLGGGIRFGEMERDAGASHGASAFLNDRLNKSSDAYKAVFCTTCGTETEVRKGLDGAVCRVCKTRGKYGVTEVPYAFRVLTGRLAMAGVRVNLLSLYSRADRFKRFDEEVEDPTETFNAANKKEGVPEEEEKAPAEPGEEEAEAEEEEEEEEEVVEEEDVPMYDEEED